MSKAAVSFLQVPLPIPLYQLPTFATVSNAATRIKQIRGPFGMKLLLLQGSVKKKPFIFILQNNGTDAKNTSSRKMFNRIIQGQMVFIYVQAE